MTMKTRTCKCCGEEKPLEEFMRGAFGYMSLCKKCHHQKSMEGKMRKAAENSKNPLEKFTPRELLAELKRRGYRWQKMEVTITQDVPWEKI